MQLAFAGVNPVDRYGLLGRVAPDGPLPRTLGSEATGWLDGVPVLVHGAGLGSRRDGLWATAAIVPRTSVIALPPGVELDQAAAVGVAGATAIRVVELAEVGPGARVVVLGATGGVGHMCCSLLRDRGAVVIAQSAHADKRQFLERCGAHEIAIFDEHEAETALAALEPDAVLDPLGSSFSGAAIAALRPHGRLVLYGTSAGASGEVPLQLLYRKELRVLGYGGLIEPEERLVEACEAALEALAQGRLKIVIGERQPLGRVNEGLEHLARRAVLGKLVLELQA